ncbi:hypothetical protein [Pseudomonas citronellolis]|nr:hypothetical protein [Pseudomonas citronellolis]
MNELSVPGLKGKGFCLDISQVKNKPLKPSAVKRYKGALALAGMGAFYPR